MALQCLADISPVPTGVETEGLIPRPSAGTSIGLPGQVDPLATAIQPRSNAANSTERRNLP